MFDKYSIIQLLKSHTPSSRVVCGFGVLLWVITWIRSAKDSIVAYNQQTLPGERAT